MGKPLPLGVGFPRPVPDLGLPDLKINGFRRCGLVFPTLILRMPCETTKTIFGPFLGDWLSYGIHTPFIPLVRWFRNLGIIRVEWGLGLPNCIHLFLHGLGTHEIQRRHIGALIQGKRSPFLVILMTLDSVFLSDFHLAEKVQGEVGEFKSSRLALLIIKKFFIVISTLCLCLSCCLLLV